MPSATGIEKFTKTVAAGFPPAPTAKFAFQHSMRLLKFRKPGILNFGGPGMTADSSHRA